LVATAVAIPFATKENQQQITINQWAALPQRSAISFMGMIRFRRGLSRAG
jgi:hypothetical protein